MGSPQGSCAVGVVLLGGSWQCGTLQGRSSLLSRSRSWLFLPFSQAEAASRSCVFQGVKIFDVTSKQRITNVPRDDVSLRPDMYPCSLCWKDSVTLIVGWGTSVKVVLLVFPLSPRCYKSTADGPGEPGHFPLHIVVM